MVKQKTTPKTSRKKEGGLELLKKTWQDPKARELIWRAIGYLVVLLIVVYLIYSRGLPHPSAGLNNALVLATPALIVFFLLGRHKFVKLFYRQSWMEILAFLIISGGLFILRYQMEPSVYRAVVTMGGAGFLALAFFGWKFFWSLKIEVVVTALLFFITWQLSFSSLWQWLVQAAGYVVSKMLSLTFDNVSLNYIDYGSGPSPQIVVGDRIRVGILRGCSGVQSMSIYVILFLAAIGVEMKRLILKKAVWFFLLGLVIVFALVILRIYILILIGAVTDTPLIYGTMHNVAGMVFFVIFFVLFIYYTFRRMQKPLGVTRKSKK